VAAIAAAADAVFAVVESAQCDAAVAVAAVIAVVVVVAAAAVAMAALWGAAAHLLGWHLEQQSAEHCAGLVRCRGLTTRLQQPHRQLQEQQLLQHREFHLASTGAYPASSERSMQAH